MQWQLIIKLNDVDISNRIIDTITIEAEEDTARIAEFTISAYTYGEINLSNFIGKSLTIDFVSVEPALTPVRVFTGIVDYPEYDIKTKTTRLRCTDDMQKKALSYMNKTTGDFWLNTSTNTAIYEDVVFGDYTKKKGSEQLEAARATLLKTVDIDRLGTFVATSFEPKTLPDYTFNEGNIVNDSLSVTFATRQQIKNQVVIKLDYRYNRLKQANYAYSWTHPGVCYSIETGLWFPSLEMVKQAYSSTGFNLLYIDYEYPPPADWYLCGGSDVMWIMAPEVRKNLIGSLNLVLAKRYAQSVTDKYVLTVGAQASIDNLGVLADNESVSLEANSFNLTEWLNNYSYGPFINDHGKEVIHDTRDHNVSITQVNNGIKALIAKAKREIVNSHRSNFVQFTTPILPELDRHHTVLIDTAEVQAKGKVKHLQHSFNTQAGTALTQVKVALSLIDAVGAQEEETPIEAPAGTTTPAGTLGLSTTLDNHISNSSSDTTSESSDGYVGNGPLGSNPHEFRINVPEITAAQQEAITNDITTTYNVQIRDDLLSVLA